jgi:hypothetical protein
MPAADGAGPGTTEPDAELPDRRPGESITDYGAAAFLLVLFLLALGLMHLIGRGY